MARTEEEQMKKIAFVGIGGFVLLIGAVLGIGALIPEDHAASRSAHYAQPPEVVWRAITEYDEFPAWRPSVDGVEPLADAGGATGWVERPCECAAASPSSHRILMPRHNIGDSRRI